MCYSVDNIKTVGSGEVYGELGKVATRAKFIFRDEPGLCEETGWHTDEMQGHPYPS